MKKKFCRDVFSLAFTAMLFLQISAQQKALKIGDPIPEEVWKTPLQVVNSPQKTMTLEAEKEKLILLDFWATWCSSCLKNFPKMEVLQQQYGDRLKIIPVTSQGRLTLEQFFASKNGNRFKSIVSVTEDPMLSKFFPHYAVPFIVWIKDGKLINTTDAGQVTEETVREILGGEKSSLETVLQIGRNRPLMLAEQFDLEKEVSLMNYALLSKGRIKAIAPGSGFHRKDGKVYGRQWTNISLMNIYRGIAYEIFELRGESFSEKRIVNLVKNPSQIDFTINHEDDPVGDRLYSFEFIVPLKNTDSLYPSMIKALSEFSGYPAVLEKQRKKCLVLRRTGLKDLMKSKGGEQVAEFSKSPVRMHNTPLEFLTVELNVNSRLTPLPVVDETGYTGNVDMDLGMFTDLASLKKALRNYGLDLSEEERDLLMLMVKDQP